MGYKENYESWLNNPYFDEDTRNELKGIAGNEKEIEDRFYMDLEFGTAGLRGVIGAGTNRMNIYTVRKATQGLANYIASVNGQDRGVAIAYDSRRMSQSLRMKRRFVSRQTALKPMFLNPYVRRRSFPTRCVSWAALRALT